MIIQSRARALVGAIFAATAAGGAIAAWHYHARGLTLSHYDARGHLIVARRIVDSITPGWQQIGAVWLPLPHLLNVAPVQIDAFYRTGASAVAISIVAFAVAAAAIGWIVVSLTGSPAAAVAAAAVFALNPNIVYLQATPMTEPLLLALTTLGVAMLLAWVNGVGASARTHLMNGGVAPRAARRPAGKARRPRISGIFEGGATPPAGMHRGPNAGPIHEMGSSVGLVLALACLTRYEAWPVTYAALAIAAWALWRRGEPPASACRRVAAIGLYPTAAIAGFAIFSRVVGGHWFVSDDFFVPENTALGLPIAAAAEIVWGTRELSGGAILWLAVAGGAALLVSGLARRRRSDSWLCLSLAATAAVPWAAFVDGHPFRIRYMVPAIAFEAVAIGALIGLISEVSRRLKRADLLAAAVVLCTAAYALHPLDATAPMVVEAQWDRPNGPVRQLVTNCLRARYDGTTIMASMGSLGHYMQATARDGFNLRDFLHEGNGDIWLAALEAPRPYAGWLLIEEKAQGGDRLARRAREHPDFLAGYSRVCEGAGVALYERQNRMLNVKR